MGTADDVDAGSRPPTALEQCVLLAAIRLGRHACRRAIEDDLAQRASLDARVAGPLATLTRRGWLEPVDPPAVRLGLRQSKAFFRVTVRGRRAVRRSLRATDAMRAGLPGLSPPG